MSSIKKKAQDNKPVCNLYVADDFRMEQSGKVTAIGLYPDLQVVFNLPEEAPEPSEELPFMFEGISLMLAVSNLEKGNHEFKFQIASTEGRKSFPEPQTGKFVIPIAGGSMNINVRLHPLNVVSFGRKDIVFEIDGQSIKGLAFYFTRGQASSSDSEKAKPKPIASSKQPQSPTVVKKASRTTRTSAKKAA